MCKLNFAHFRDKITELPENVRPAYPGNLVNTIIGHSQFDIFGYKTNGLFQSQAEVDKAPTQIGAGPGRIRYVDINNDKVINDLDRTWIGTTLPELEYGVRVDMNYKKFDFSLFGSGVAGREGFDVYTLIQQPDEKQGKCRARCIQWLDTTKHKYQCSRINAERQ